MLVENSTYPGDVRVRNEATALVAAGYQVTVVAPAGKGQPLLETVNGVRVYRFPRPPALRGSLGFVVEYASAMLASAVLTLLVHCREGFDVIHAANPPDTFVLIAAPYKLLGKRFIFDHHDLAPEMYDARQGGRGNRLVYQVQLLLERLSCRLADHVIATNASYRAVELTRDRVPPQRVTIVRNGPDPQRLRPVAPDPALRRRAPTIIAFAGVMGLQDGVDHLLRALRHLIDDFGRRDFFCVLIGGLGDAQPSLKQLARQLQLEEHVWFTGWVTDEEYVRYLSTADICVDPDPSNPFTDRSTMIKILEYMALARPIVAFDLPEHRVSAQEAALYARPNDDRDLARAIAQLMDDPARRRAMGELGRRRVETTLAWRYSIPHLLAAYQAVLPAAAQPGVEPHEAARRSA